MPWRSLRRWPWPLPALVAWSAGWAVVLAVRHAGLGWTVAFGLGSLASLALAWPLEDRWRRLLAAAGFPLSAGLLGLAQGLPPALWLMPLALLLLAYPVRAWRDAPLFPTPPQALRGLADVVGQPGRVLDAGCGLGHGLKALRRQWPRAQLLGVEWSAPLALLARWRVAGATVRHGDMWALPWGDVDLVYLFQRPETMPRAWAKACAEMAPGSWLVSLEFPVPGVQPVARLGEPGDRPVWVYRIGRVRAGR